MGHFDAKKALGVDDIKPCTECDGKGTKDYISNCNLCGGYGSIFIYKER